MSSAGARRDINQGHSRVLSKPSSPRSNDGRDNVNDDLILRAGEELRRRCRFVAVGIVHCGARERTQGASER